MNIPDLHLKVTNLEQALPFQNPNISYIFKRPKCLAWRFWPLCPAWSNDRATFRSRVRIRAMLVEFSKCSRAVTLLATRQLSLLSHSRSISHAPRQIDKALSSQTTSLSWFRRDRPNDRFQHTLKTLPVFNHPGSHTNPNFLKVKYYLKFSIVHYRRLTEFGHG